MFPKSDADVCIVETLGEIGLEVGDGLAGEESGEERLAEVVRAGGGWGEGTGLAIGVEIAFGLKQVVPIDAEAAGLGVVV